MGQSLWEFYLEGIGLSLRGGSWFPCKCLFARREAALIGLRGTPALHPEGGLPKAALPPSIRSCSARVSRPRRSRDRRSPCCSTTRGETCRTQGGHYSATLPNF